MGKFYGLRGTSLNWAVGIIAGMDFLLFGYDQGVMGGLLTLPVFLNQFPSINTAPDSPQMLAGANKDQRSTYQGIAVASYNLGCLFGAIATIFLGNPLGRKKTILIGSSIMIIGATLQCSAFSLAQFVVGRIITGLGNGANTSTVPTWQSETSKSHNRGKLVMVEGALITGGIMISYWFDYGMSFTAPNQIAWRLPIAFQIVFALIIVCTIMGLPESPRWLILKGRETEAMEVLTALADADENDKFVRNEFQAIKDTVLEQASGTFSDCFAMTRDREFHRVALAYINQMFQQISGINLITYYAATLFGRIGLNDNLSRLLAACNGTEYFLASWIAVALVEKTGRRKLMMFGAGGMSLSMVVLAVTSKYSAKPYMNTGSGIVAAVFLFVFNTFFAIGWLGMTWLYPAEIVPLRIRAPANAMATSANWLFNFLVVMITPVAFQNIQWQTYIIFAVINAFIFPFTYFFFPETAYRSLEEMDSIFHKAEGKKGWFSVVHIANSEPHRYGKKGELLIDYEQTEEAQEGRRRSSIIRAGSVGGDPEKSRFGAEGYHTDAKTE